MMVLTRSMTGNVKKKVNPELYIFDYHVHVGRSTLIQLNRAYPVDGHAQ